MLLIGRATWEICFSQSEVTTQIWVVTRHQYGISALVSQTSFRGNQRWRREMSAVFLGYGSCALKYFNLQKFEHRVASLQSIICKREGNGEFLLIRS